MRKTIAAVTVGLLLVAGQAAAANELSTDRVGDRVGAASTSTAQVQSFTNTTSSPVWVTIFGVTIVVAVGQTLFFDQCTSGC